MRPTLRRLALPLLLVVFVAAVVRYCVSESPQPETIQTRRLEPGSAATPASPRPGRLASDAAANGNPATKRVLRGTVTDAAGTPICDAEVTALDGYPSGTGQVLSVAATGADGTYTLTNAGLSAVVVRAQKDGFAPQVEWAREDETTLVLSPGAMRSLLVVDERGSPVSHATVELAGDGAATRAATMTDADGRARLVTEERAHVIVRARGFAHASYEIAAPDDRDRIHRIVLGEGRTISGVVTRGDGAPVSNVTVTLRGWGPCTRYHADASVRTGADGSFSFDGVGPDPEETPWRVSLGDDDWVATPVFAVPGQNDVRIVAHRGAVIRGSIVYPDGTPVAGASVRSDAWPYEVVADGRGRFEAIAVPPGPQRITATARSPEGMDVGWRGSVDVDVSDGSSTDGIRLVVGADPGRSFISVEVFNADGTPTVAADVKLWCECVEVDAFPVPGGALCVDVPPGTLLTITAHVTTETMTSCARSDSPVPTSESPRPEPCVLRLEPVGVLRLRLEDAVGSPVALSRATVVSDRQPSPDGYVPLAADETFTATIRVPGFAARSVRFEPPQPRTREETVRLRPAGGLRGRIVGANGGSVPGTAVVSARVVGDSDSVETLSASIDAGGRFRLDEAPAGRATLLVSLDGRPAVRREYDLPAGDILDVGEIVLPALVRTGFIVVSGEGRPLGGAVVSFLDPGGVPFGPLTTSRSDGTFEVVAAGAVPMQVLVCRAGYGTRVVDRSCDADQPQRISLGTAGRVHVLAPAVTDAGPRRVEAVIPGAPLGRWTPAEVGSSGSSGLRTPEGVVFDGFPAGPVEIRLVTSRRRLSRLVDVVAGATVECRFGP